ncbi:D-aminoacyl-tRNA deacylase [[Candida] jaroonii]|uniref:D-aminoacyl-tRNA deacylase n=1 Tax=[Candida] jaroonii TaxID=467808 RepID=A0ACA9YFQ7_9ASCO|nr:D-aminoacyl-tRNA deacylase [[Candida] jaroonii]
MKIVIQKVKSASVTVNHQLISSITKGLMVLVGISTSDTPEDITKMSKKLLNLRIFEDLAIEDDRYSGKPWSKSIKDLGLEVLCVSQFTLYGTVTKGTKPDFHKAEKGPIAREKYEEFLSQLRVELGDKVKDGKFGEMMEVSLVNDGPVTIVYET